MSELVKRSLFGGLYVLVVLSGILFSPILTFGLTAIFIAIGYRELRKMFKADLRIYITPALAAFGLWSFSLFSYTQNSSTPELGNIIVIGFLVILIEHIWTVNSEHSTARLGNSLIAFLYLGIPCALAPWLSLLEGFFNPTPLLGIFVLIWCNDSFAYLIGKSFGKKPLHKRLSPKKSLEGLIGGLVFSILAAFALSQLTISSLTQYDWYAFAMLAGIGGTLGDLFESSLKRVAGVKDSGAFIPGHGGLLDRVDSFMFVVPLAWLYLSFQ